MSTVILKAEVQTRIDALTYPIDATVLLQNAVDTVGLDLDLTNIISVLAASTAAIDTNTPNDDVTALNATSIALGVTRKGGGIPVALGGVTPLHQDDVLIELEGLIYLRSGNVIEGEQSSYPNVQERPVDVSVTYSGKEDSVSDIVANDCLGIAWDGTHFWVLDYANTLVKQVDTEWNPTGVEFSVHATPYGLVWDGVQFWVGSYNNENTYSYTSTGVSNNTIASGGYVANNGYGSIAYKDGEVFITDTVSGKVYKFKTSDGTYIGQYNIPSDSHAITYDPQASCFWIDNITSGIIQQYSEEFLALSLSIDRNTINASLNFTLCKGEGEDLVFIPRDRIRYTLDVIGGGLGIGLSATIFDNDTNLPYYMRVK